jgi:putative DNA primase/helicase
VTPTGNQAFSIVRMDSVEPAAVEWLWTGWLAAGKLHLMAGMPGVGKSFVTCDLASRITTGDGWPDGSAAAPISDVIFLSGEDGLADTIRPRLDAHGADVSRVHVLQARLIRGITETEERQVSLQRDADQLDALLADNPAVRVLFIDPIAEYLGDVDSHKNSAVRSALAPLSRIAERRNVAIVAVSHFHKGSEGPAIYRANGSIAFTALARIAWAFVRDIEDADRVLMLPIKNNLHRRPDGLAYRIDNAGTAGRVQWESQAVKITADEAMAPRKKGPPPEKRAEAEEWLRSMLANGPIGAAELKSAARRSGISLETLKRARKVLDVKTGRDSAGKRIVFLSASGSGDSPLPYLNH